MRTTLVIDDELYRRVKAKAAMEGRRVTEALRNHFRPEFLNRIDEIIIFDRLTEADLDEIVKIQLGRVCARLEKKGVHISLTEAAERDLASEGYDPAFGARPLKRVIQRRILDPLSLEILEGNFKEGDRIEIDHSNGAFTFKKG